MTLKLRPALTLLGAAFAFIACGPALENEALPGDQNAVDLEMRKKKDAGTSQPDAGHADAGGTSNSSDAGVKRLPAIFTIVFENHDYDEVVGSPDAPYFNELIARYGSASNYSDCLIHPSLGNYLCMLSGDPQYPGGVDLLPTASFPGGKFPVDAKNLGSQMLAAHLAFKSYQENMSTPCKLVNGGLYAPKHDPFLYFKDMQLGGNSLCAQTNVDASELTADMNNDVNRFYFITPNLENDGHDPFLNPRAGLRNADAFLKKQMAAIFASNAYKNGGIVFITWDEAEGRNGDSKSRVSTIIVSENIVSPGFTSAVAYDHRSYLATVEDLLRLPRLPTTQSAPSMMEFFKPGH